MTEPNWYEIALAAVIAAIGWLFKRHVNRVDTLEENYVKREELNQKFTRMEQERKEERREMREDRARMHQENTEALHYLRERVDELVDRR